MLRLALQRTRLRKRARLSTQCGREPLAGSREVLTHDVGQTLVYAGAQCLRLVPQHIAQPVAALLEHVREQLLDVAPIVVQTLKEKLDIPTEVRIALRGHEGRPRGAVIQLPRPIGDGERSARLGRYGQLTGQPEIEGVNGLNAQPAGILCEIPTSRGTPGQGGGSQRLQALALCGGGVEVAV